MPLQLEQHAFSSFTVQLYFYKKTSPRLFRREVFFFYRKVGGYGFISRCRLTVVPPTCTWAMYRLAGQC